LPAALIVEGYGTADIPAVQASSIQSYMTIAAHSLTQVSEARVPLENAENARVLAFRPRDGGIEHLAIVVGELNPAEPVLVRLHSECFTGDLVGSLRCDCGNQLRGAIGEMAVAGSGILLYLRKKGVALVWSINCAPINYKMPALIRLMPIYSSALILTNEIICQRRRYYACWVLSRVKLMTNNPAKVTALGNCGIEVVERVPHIYPSNQHNDAYLKVKAKKSGHLF
jgi:GTP cyclohydrolase II